MESSKYFSKFVSFLPRLIASSIESSTRTMDYCHGMGGTATNSGCTKFLIKDGTPVDAANRSR